MAYLSRLVEWLILSHGILSESGIFLFWSTSNFPASATSRSSEVCILWHDRTKFAASCTQSKPFSHVLVEPVSARSHERTTYLITIAVRLHNLLRCACVNIVSSRMCARTIRETERSVKFLLATTVPGWNKGQVAKEFAIHNGLDVFSLDKRPKSTRIRARKLRMPGGEISVPTHRTVEGIKEDWTKMIQSGELTLGEPCYPHTITRYSIKDGELKTSWNNNVW